jgi:O-methyltransferase
VNEHVKTLARRMLPARLVRLIQHCRRGAKVSAADLAAIWEYKRPFFWNAFKVLDFNGIDGDYVEFGSYGGMTFRLAFDQIRQRRIPRHMWAFDSFQGLPAPSSPIDDHPRWRKGAMAADVDMFHRICSSHGIPREGYTTVRGFYEETLTQMPADAAPTNIALAYVDCDMYSSTKTVLEFLSSRLKHGMILAFDDYFCWSADQVSGERKAMLDVLASDQKWRFVRYRDYGWAGASFVVERADLHSPQVSRDRAALCAIG